MCVPVIDTIIECVCVCIGSVSASSSLSDNSNDCKSLNAGKLQVRCNTN